MISNYILVIFSFIMSSDQSFPDGRVPVTMEVKILTCCPLLPGTLKCNNNIFSPFWQFHLGFVTFRQTVQSTTKSCHGQNRHPPS